MNSDLSCIYRVSINHILCPYITTINSFNTTKEKLYNTLRFALTSQLAPRSVALLMTMLLAFPVPGSTVVNTSQASEYERSTGHSGGNYLLTRADKSLEVDKITIQLNS